MRKLDQKTLLEIQKKLTKHFQWVSTAGRKGKRLTLDEIDLSNIYDKTFLMESAFLTACKFSNVTFEKTDFYTAELYSCIFNNSNLNNCDFRKATLDYSEFHNCCFKECSFGRTDLYEAQIIHSLMKQCSFVGIGLMKCNLSLTTLDNVNFDYSYLEAVKVNGTKFINPQNLDLAVKLSLDISTDNNPIIIEGKEAIDWILKHN